MSEAYNLEHIASRNTKPDAEAALLNVDLGAEVAEAVKVLQQELAELRRLLRAAGDNAPEKLSTGKVTN